DVVLTGHPSAELKSRSTLQVWERGEYVVTTASGRTMSARVTNLPRPVDVEGAWDVRFPPNLGAPSAIKLEKLIPLNEHPDERITWTAFESYKKDSPLLPSGLIGPVRLVPAVVVPLQNK